MFRQQFRIEGSTYVLALLHELWLKCGVARKTPWALACVSANGTGRPICNGRTYQFLHNWNKNPALLKEAATHKFRKIHDKYHVHRANLVPVLGDSMINGKLCIWS